MQIKLNPTIRRAIHNAHANTCVYCQKNESSHIDHIDPKWRGEDRDNLLNLVPACGSCNMRKGAHLLDDDLISIAKDSAKEKLSELLELLGYAPLPEPISYGGVYIDLKNKNWTPSETVALIALIDQYELKSWRQFCKILGKTEAQVRAKLVAHKLWK